MSDFMYGVLAVSVAWNLWAIGKIGQLRGLLFKTDNMLKAVARGDAEIIRCRDRRGEIDWTVKKLK